MKPNLPVLRHISLSADNTFGIAAVADAFMEISDAAQLAALADDPQWSAMPRLILGGGSNLVLSDQIPRLVLKMTGKGIAISAEDADYVYVTAQAGERWHDLVRWTLSQGLGGLENLSLIPGTAGAAPVQNIGAYGLELKDVFSHLEAWDFASRAVRRFTLDECCFAYRDSIFKQAWKDRAAILSITLRLPRRWTPKLAYADLQKYFAGRDLATLSATEISDGVVQIRQQKLPDPAVIGNAGSFFKNPVVSAAQHAELQQAFPALVSYPAGEQFKLAAGWLIDQCGWKGQALGAAGVYHKQALVLVNLGGATGADIRALAQKIQQDVQQRFGVLLEPEPVFV